MSTVAPNGQVRLLANVPLDDSYEDSIYWENVTAQSNYFLGLTPVHTMNNCTRVKDMPDGVIRVDVGEDTIRHCNYLMFQNQNFSSKWFYAFIMGTQFVNNNMTYVYYKIDVVQTWQFDLTFLDCMIEREHTTTDNIYEHILPEDIGAPELKLERVLQSYGFSNTYDAIVFTSSYLDVDEESGDTDWYASPITCINNLLTMSQPTARANSYILDGAVRSASWTVLESILNDLILDNKGDSIIGGVIMPSEFANTNTGSQGTDRNISKSTSGLFSGIDGYTPKNKKLYNSPYCVIRLQTSDGQCVFLQPEYISGNYISFRQISVCSMTPELTIIPENYKGQSIAYSEALTFTKFPQFSVAVDGYKAWVASGGLEQLNLNLSQTERSIQLEKSTTAVKGGLGVIEGASQATVGGIEAYYTGGLKGSNDIFSGATKAGESVINAELTRLKLEQQLTFANENYDLQHAIAKTFPPSLKGSSSGNSLASDLKIGYTVDKMVINSEQAEAIDNYFTLFGYKTNRMGTPNRKARPHFTYVKTSNCKVTGGAPTSDIDLYESIHNAGIRYWVDPSEIGQYSTIDNSPAS